MAEEGSNEDRKVMRTDWEWWMSLVANLVLEVELVLMLGVGRQGDMVVCGRAELSGGCEGGGRVGRLGWEGDTIGGNREMIESSGSRDVVIQRGEAVQAWIQQLWDRQEEVPPQLEDEIVVVIGPVCWEGGNRDSRSSWELRDAPPCVSAVELDWFGKGGVRGSLELILALVIA